MTAVKSSAHSSAKKRAKVLDDDEDDKENEQNAKNTETKNK